MKPIETIDSVVKKKKKSSRTVSFLKLYMLPLFTISIFLGILLFLIIPKVQSMFDGLKQLEELNKQIKQEDLVLTSLNVLKNKASITKNQLEQINSFAPESDTDVIEFRNKITDLATTSNLEVTQQQLSENDNTVGGGTTSTVSGQLTLVEVPTRFSLTGKYSNIYKFLNDLADVDDFIIIKDMKLTSETLGEADSWRLDLIFVKYQFGIADVATMQTIYSNVSPEAKIDEYVIDYLNSKVL